MSSQPPNKRHRRGGKKGDSVEAVRKQHENASRDKNVEQKNRAREVSSLVRDERQMKEEIDKLSAEPDTADNAQQIKLLRAALQKHQADTQRRLKKQELDSELARKRKLQSGLQTGPPPPPMDPPRRGPGFPPPVVLLDVARVPSPPPQEEEVEVISAPARIIAAMQQPPSRPVEEKKLPSSTKLFVPVAVQKKRA